MNFEYSKSVQLLRNTPLALEQLLQGIPDSWTRANEGENSWSPYDILGHLIHGEKTDWIPRAEIILGQKEDRQFEPFDRFAQFAEDQERDIDELLEEFAGLRRENLNRLSAMQLGEEELALEGIHPEFGTVNLRELLAAWVVHDLGHLAQLSRVMAKQYKADVGPWVAYMRILNS